MEDERKMTELERIRHSAAHVMATAILRCGRKRNLPPACPSRTTLLLRACLKNHE
jgi:hypothetical protein